LVVAFVWSCELRVQRLRLGGLLFLGMAGALGLAERVLAAPLDPAACEAVRSEHALLAEGGVTQIIAKGPEWGKANASKSDLVRVARWIELEEQLTFRCGQGRVTEGAQRAAAMAQQLENPPTPPPEDKAAPGSAPVLAEPAAVEPAPKPKPKPKAEAKPRPAAARPEQPSTAAP
jgi:hypothetical protein